MTIVVKCSEIAKKSAKKSARDVKESVDVSVAKTEKTDVVVAITDVVAGN